jgi:hypothetical protein
MLQAGRSRDRAPMRWTFSIYLILPHWPVPPLINQPGHPGAPIMMLSLVRTPSQRESLSTRTPNLKSFSIPGLQVAGLQEHATTPRSWDSVVGIAIGYGLDGRGVGVRVPVGSRIFCTSPNRLWGPPNLLSNGYGAPSLGVKRPGREADHSPPASAEVNKMWIYTSTPPIHLHGVVLS